MKLRAIRRTLMVLIVLAAVVLLAYQLLPRIGTLEREDSAHTQLTFSHLMRAIEAFHKGFEQYPPSHFTDEPYDMQKFGGAGLLAYYLMGPKAAGWGGEDPQVLPFGGTSGTPIPAYFGFDPKVVVVAGDMRPIGFNDFFQPPQRILYFRAGPGCEPLFDVRDNPVDPICKTGFASQKQFEMSVKQKGSDGRVDWVRKDYLLISAGQDRRFGHVIVDPKSGIRPALPEEAEKAGCDDVMNW